MKTKQKKKNWEKSLKSETVISLFLLQLSHLVNIEVDEQAIPREVPPHLMGSILIYFCLKRRTFMKHENMFFFFFFSLGFMF